MPFEWLLALRFLREGRTQTLLILAGATVGVAVIIFLTALISGLQSTLVEQILSSQAHVILKRPERVARVLPAAAGEAVAALVEKVPERERSVEQWQQLLELVRQHPEVVAAAPTAAGSAFAARGEVVKSVALRGVEPASFEAVIRVARKLVEGRWQLEGTQAVIGAVLAADLGLSVGDKLRLTSAQQRSELFTVTGVFDFGNRDVNQRWVLVPLRAAQTLLDLSGGITTIEAKVQEPFGAEAVARDLAAGTGLSADSWIRTNAQLLVALQSQSSSSWLIQLFVVVAVALGIASVLGVSVIQKSREIGILKAMGTSTGSVQRIFLIEGGLVGLVGSVAGGVLGAGLSLLFSHAVKNPYGDSLFPVDLRPGLFVVASAVALLTGVISALVPARHAARLEPAVVIRNG